MVRPGSSKPGHGRVPTVHALSGPESDGGHHLLVAAGGHLAEASAGSFNSFSIGFPRRGIEESIGIIERPMGDEAAEGDEMLVAHVRNPRNGVRQLRHDIGVGNEVHRMTRRPPSRRSGGGR